MDEDGATMKTPRLRWIVMVIAMLCATPLAEAHVGNKDIFQRVSAGPYSLFVTIRTPNVIPGVAVIEVRVDSPDPSAANQVTSIHIAPLPLTGMAAKNLPTPDAMKPEPGLPGSYTGSLWLMSPGSWQVHLDVDGKLGHAEAGVPVPAVALSTLKMQRPLGFVLAFLALVLVTGMAGIVAASLREASLLPGDRPTTSRRRRSMIAGAATLVALLAACVAGNRWWNVSAANYAEGIYRPLKLMPLLADHTLKLEVGTGASDVDSVHTFGGPSDLVLDHGKIMHLYAIRFPEMDVVLHLHPHMTTDWRFEETLPTAMLPGTYKLFADIVHRNGFPETLTAEITVPAAPSSDSNILLQSDNAYATPAPLSAGMLPETDKLPDGYTMVWAAPVTIHAGTGYTFHFTLLDPSDKPATNVVPYLGMAGHAAFVKADFSTFAHTHPDGSAAMPAVMMANSDNETMSGMATGSMDGPLPPVVEFPYGFPSAGRYRIFIQMRHSNPGGCVETGVFDADVK
jgi:hypothetical protein